MQFPMIHYKRTVASMVGWGHSLLLSCCLFHSRVTSLWGKPAAMRGNYQAAYIEALLAWNRGFQITAYQQLHDQA